MTPPLVIVIVPSVIPVPFVHASPCLPTGIPSATISETDATKVPVCPQVRVTVAPYASGTKQILFLYSWHDGDGKLSSTSATYAGSGAPTIDSAEAFGIFSTAKEFSMVICEKIEFLIILALKYKV